MSKLKNYSNENNMILLRINNKLMEQNSTVISSHFYSQMVCGKGGKDNSMVKG